MSDAIVTQGKFVVDVSAPLEGSITDWPSNIQDKFYRLVASQALADGVPYEIINSVCDVDPDTGVASLIVFVEARQRAQ